MKRILGLLISSLLLTSCFAFEDTSPFILAVSHKYESLSLSSTGLTIIRTAHISQLDDTQSHITISADHFHTVARQTVSQCSSQVYILVSQPGVHVTDFTVNTVPYLRKVVKNAESKITADYGHGQVDLEDISQLVQDKCLAESTFVDARRTYPIVFISLIVDATFPVFETTNKIRVVTIDFGELPERLSRRRSHLSDNGNSL